MWWEILVHGLLTGGVFGLVAIGLTLIFGVMNVVNFAHGQFLMAGMMLTVALVTRSRIDPYLAAVALLPAMALLGLLTYLVVIRPTIGRILFVQVVATLGLVLLLQNLALILFGADVRVITNQVASAPVQLLGVTVQRGELIAFGAALALTAGLHLFLIRSAYGRAIRAVTDDTLAARLIGLNVNRAYAAVFVIGIVFAMLSGALIAPQVPVSPYSGSDYGLISFVVVVLGGFGSVLGAMLGGLLIGVVQVATAFLIGPQWTELALFLIFVVVLLVRPTGLLGTATVGSEAGRVGTR